MRWCHTTRMQKSVLIVDDDRTERRMITGILRKGIDVQFKEAENGKDALRILDKCDSGDIALIVLDLDMPVMGGLEALEIIGKSYAHIPVIVLTGDTDTQNAVQAMKLGASDFLSKPVEGARLDVSVRNALKMSLMSREISRLRRHADDVMQFSDLIGHDNGLKDSVVVGRKAAACNLPALVTGETGTGKEMFARAIHGESARSGHSFIAVNCGAIPEKLVESTLFGHEKGAFTGAVHKSAGKFQEAHGGTIFLDEIGELAPDAQVKLLRVLQEGDVEPVGASKPISVDVRVVSATNRDLAEEVREGRFREDLYFRLNVLHVDLPPLRARMDDIPLIAAYFIAQFCASHHVMSKDINDDAMKKLCAYHWPGNVRELENVINRTMAMCDETVLQPDHFSFVQPVQDSVLPAQEGVIVPVREDGGFKTYKELEQDIVRLALAHHENNISKTAKVLGIAKSTLYTKIDSLTDVKNV